MIAALTFSPQWTLLFNVLFGAIASRAFAEFYQSITDERDRDADPSKETRGFGYYLLRLFVFVSAFSFFVYDWIVIQILYAKYPYEVTNFYSYIRFANDLFMSFCLFGIVWSSARPRTLLHPLRLIVPVSAWHILAAIWHVLADVEYSTNIDFDFPLQWHLIYVQLLYWVPFALLVNLRKVKNDRERQRRAKWIIGIESLIIMSIAMVRTFIVLYSTTYIH